MYMYSHDSIILFVIFLLVVLFFFGSGSLSQFESIAIPQKNIIFNFIYFNLQKKHYNLMG